MSCNLRPTGRHYSCSVIEAAMMPDSESTIVHGLTAFKNWVLREPYELKRDQIIAGWRKLHNEKPPHNLLLAKCN
jgi:hypothetical protein